MRPVGELVKRKMNGEKDISRSSDEHPRAGAFLQVVKLVAHAHGKCVCSTYYSRFSRDSTTTLIHSG